jgi:predicted HicB family RNase H-like nuclease
MMRETKYQKFVVYVTDSLYRDIGLVAGYQDVSMSKWAFDILQAEVNKALAKPDETTPAQESHHG